MNNKSKNRKDKMDNLEGKLENSILPYLNEDFEELTLQLKNLLIFLAYKEENKPLLKNIH